MPNVLAVTHPDAFAKWIGDQGRLGFCISVGRILSSDPLVRSLGTSDSLYLVTSRPDGALWLLLVMEHPRPDELGCWFDFNRMPITDISELRGSLDLPTPSPKAYAYAALSDHASQLLKAVHTRILESSEAAGVEARKAEASRSRASALAKKEAKRRGTAKKAKRTPMLGLLIDAALAQVEEVASEVSLDPELMLLPPAYAEGLGLRGRFTLTVQSIFEGGIDAAEGTQLLAEELCPFVDGTGLALILRELSSASSTHPAQLVPRLVDAFAIRAVDDLARTFTALALGKPKAVPPTCAGVVALLGDDVERARALLGEA